MKKVLEVRLFVVSLLCLLVLKEDGTYLTIRPAAHKGYVSISHEAKPIFSFGFLPDECRTSRIV